jgi:hypothetical protein
MSLHVLGSIGAPLYLHERDATEVPLPSEAMPHMTFSVEAIEMKPAVRDLVRLRA